MWSPCTGPVATKYNTAHVPLVSNVGWADGEARSRLWHGANTPQSLILSQNDSAVLLISVFTGELRSVPSLRAVANDGGLP